jgi:hypothetical protein
MKHYHDFSRWRFFGLPLTRWTCACGIKTWRRVNVTLLQSTTTVHIREGVL